MTEARMTIRKWLLGALFFVAAIALLTLPTRAQNGYNPANWYWTVADTNPSTQVYSSASGSFVVLADATYVAWLAAGNTPSTIDTAAHLYTALGQYSYQAQGYTVTNLGNQGGTSYTLTNPLTAAYSVAPTNIAGLDLKLPIANAANSLPLGKPLRIYFRSGASNLRIRDNANNLITTITYNVGDTFACYYADLILNDNTTQPGSWQLPSVIPCNDTLLSVTSVATVTNKTFGYTDFFNILDSSFYLSAVGDNSKQLKWDLSSFTAATVRSIKPPNASTTLAGYTDNLSVFAATTSAQLAGVLSDETGSGAAMFGTSPVVTTDIRPASDGGADLGTSALRWGTLFANTHTASGQAARIWSVARNITSNTAGNNLVVQAGGATSGATDKAGGALGLYGGQSTGTGASTVTISLYRAAASTGTSDNALYNAATFSSGGIAFQAPDNVTAFSFQENLNSNYRFAINIVSGTGGANAASGYPQFYDNYSGSLTAGFIQQSGAVIASAATDSTGTNTGSLQTYGGLYAAKRVFHPGLTTSAGLQTAVICQSSAGEMIADSVACLASSARFKDGFAAVSDQAALGMVLAMQPKAWHYKREGNIFPDAYYRERIGFLAEDLAAIDPRLASFDANGQPRSDDYNAVVTIQTGAIRALKAGNDNLREELREIRRMLAR